MRTAPLLLLAALPPGLAVASPQNGSRLLSVSRDDARLREIDPMTGVTRTSVAMTAPGQFLVNATGLAVHPGTSEVYLLFQGSQPGRQLGKVDPATGAVTVLGNTGNQFAGLAFDTAGTLYGVTGDGAATHPETLFTLDLATGQPTLFLALGNGTGGEAIAFAPPRGTLLHGSGVQRGPGPNEILEHVDLVARTVAPIPIAGDDYEEAFALTWWVGDAFLLTDINADLFLVSGTGLVTRLAVLDHTAKGLAFLPADQSAASFAPYGQGCAAGSGYVPVLAGTGRPGFQSQVSIDLANGPGGGPGVFLFGSGPGVLPVGNGCTLHNAPLFALVLPFVLGGSGNGRGRLTLPVTVPGPPAFDVYLQAAVFEGAAPLLGNALRMSVR